MSSLVQPRSNRLNHALPAIEANNVLHFLGLVQDFLSKSWDITKEATSSKEAMKHAVTCYLQMATQKHFRGFRGGASQCLSFNNTQGPTSSKVQLRNSAAATHLLSNPSCPFQHHASSEAHALQSPFSAI